MNSYICLLRGINVSGKNCMKMDELKSLFERIGSANVSTYIQSGNIVFEHQENNSRLLKKKIVAQILADFGLQVHVLVLTLQKLQQIITENPFVKDITKEFQFLHVTFLSDKPIVDNREIILKNKSQHEEIAFTNETVYLYCPHGYGRTKLNNNFLENKLKIQATTRNWKTTLKLLEMASFQKH